jgi:heat shock protein HslJ
MKLLPLLLLPALAGCATVSHAAPDLTGTRWRFVTIDGAAPVSDRAQLSFESGRLGANVGCNGMGGAWRVVENRIVTDGIISTMMYCDGKMEQERAVSQLLEQRPTIRLVDNRLTLRSSGHSAVLERIR